jgi:cation:H+ antiporter
MTYVLLLAGGIMLYLGAEWLVAGASRLALSLRVPKLIVGLTVVAHGTSAPEIVVGIDAALAGLGDVAVGNVVGSNIANLGLILGASMLMHSTRVEGVLLRRELAVLVVTTAALGLVLLDGVVASWEAALLLGAAVGYTAWLVLRARAAAVVEATMSATITAEAAAAGGAPATGGRRATPRSRSSGSRCSSSVAGSSCRPPSTWRARGA